MSARADLGPAFRALLTASFISNLGDGLRMAALPLLATTLTSSSFLIACVTAAQFLPWTTFAPFGGVIVDRANRRRLIITTQLWRSAIMALLSVAVLTDVVRIWHLFLVAFAITAGEILVDPSVVATVPTLVAPTDLDRANGRISTVEVVTNDFVGGPAGAIAFNAAPWLPFLLDASSYFGSTAAFRRIPSTPSASSPSKRRSFREEMGEGPRWIRQHPFLRRFTIAMAIFHLGTAGAFSLLVKLVTDVLDANRLVFGFVLSAAAVGATAATLVAARLTDRFPRRVVMTAAAIATACTVLLAGLVTRAWQLLIVWAFNGAATGIMLAIGRGFIQRNTPNDRLGRTAVASRMITRTSFVLGAVLAGAIATRTSLRWSYISAGVLHLVGAAFLWRAFRHESDSAPD